MPRLSDRAFQIVKNEIERRCTGSPEDQIERIIILARLQTLRARKGKPMTQAQIWEEISDIAPNFDQNVLIEAANVDTDSPIVGASIGVGAVAILVSTAVGMETLTVNAHATTATDSNDIEGNRDQNRTVYNADQQNTRQNAPGVDSATNRVATFFKKVTSGQNTAQTVSSQPVSSQPVSSPQESSPQAIAPIATQPSALGTTVKDTAVKDTAVKDTAALETAAFETAKSFGWKAALKSQNPPHSAQHWSEAAALWRQALAALDQVPQNDPNYTEAQTKKALYQQNLQQVEAHQRAVYLAKQRVNPAPSQTNAVATTQTPQFSSQIFNQSDDPLQIAKRYGWQAAVASQNAPHPASQWADISRLWKTALLNLDKIDANQPNYAEAQQVKARYQKNLDIIHQRYHQEQDSAQRLQSLQATLNEINTTLAPSRAKYAKLQAIVTQLKTISSGTQAYAPAQQLIIETTKQLNELAANPISQLATSSNE